MEPKTVLLINPPVYDFSAYDLWAKPLGLLYLSSILKQQNINVELFDYTDRTSYRDTNTKEKTEKNAYGCGHYLKKEIPKPVVIKNIKRKYHRFGLDEETAEKYFQNLKDTKIPDVIIIGSIMTYWYLGIAETAKTLKKFFPNTPIILGGVYATLCCEHAKTLQFIDEVVAGPLANFSPVLKKYGISAEISTDFKNFPIPDYSFYKNKEYIVLKTSIGCPFKCNYCAQYILNKCYSIKSPAVIKEEIIRLTDDEKTKNIAFYDDALLFNADNGIKILLKELQKENRKFYFHTPNGLHARFVDEELAELMFNANFIEPRFSLETSNPDEQKNSNNKVSNKEYERTIKFLNKAGYKKGGYITYLLAGMPNQDINNVIESVKYVHELGSKISLSEYSPIPYTKDWQLLTDELKQDPLTQNNTYFISLNKNYDDILKVKLLAKELNKKLNSF